MNICRIDRLNKNGGLIFYYQLIPFVLYKSEPSTLLDFKIKQIQELKICVSDQTESNLGLP